MATADKFRGGRWEFTAISIRAVFWSHLRDGRPTDVGREDSRSLSPNVHRLGTLSHHGRLRLRPRLVGHDPGRVSVINGRGSYDG